MSREVDLVATGPERAILGASARGKLSAMVRRFPRRPTMTTDTDTPIAAIKPARARRAKVAVHAAPPRAVKNTTKSDTVIKLLLRAKGATPMELIAATDWQAHSLRAFLSGLRKKGRDVVREERKGGGYAYRIVAAAATAARTPTMLDHGAGPQRAPDDTASPASAA